MFSKTSAGSAADARARPATATNGIVEAVRYGDIELDTAALVARRGDRVLRLNHTGLMLLAFFIGRPEVAHTRSQIARALWGDHEFDERTIDVYVRRLRGALRRGNEPDPIRTVRGVGYALSYQDPVPGKRSKKLRLGGKPRGAKAA